MNSRINYNKQFWAHFVMDEKVEENVPVNVEHMENAEQNMEWQIEEKKELTEEEKQQEEERKKE